jgi:tetratricopeptide (TPR) repeat protein
MGTPVKHGRSWARLALGLGCVAGALVGCRPAAPRSPASGLEALRAEVTPLLGLTETGAVEGAWPQLPGARLAASLAFARAKDPCGEALVLGPLLDDPVDADAAPRFIAAAVRLGWLDEADRALGALRPPPTPLVLQVADAHARRGAADRAASLLAGLSKRRLAPDEWLSGAVIHLNGRRAGEAARWAEKGVAGRPGDAAAALLVVRCLLTAGDPARAHRALPPRPTETEAARLWDYWDARCRAALPGGADADRFPVQSPQAAFEAAELLAETRPEAALRHYQSALHGGYQPPLCFARMAPLLERLGRRRDAAWHRGKALLLQGRLPEAASAFRAAHQIDPTHTPSALDLARALAANHRPQEALAAIERAGKSLPRDLDVAILRASLLGRLERVPAKVAALEAAAKLDPERANEPLGELGKLYYESQQYARAEAVLRDALAREDGDALAHLYLGLTLAVRRETAAGAEAVRHLLRAAAAQPDYFYPWMNAGSELERLGLLPEAAAAFRRAIGGDSRWEGPYLSLSRVLQRQGRGPERSFLLRRYALARRLETERLRLENAVSQTPQSAAARLALGDRLLRDGRPQEAFNELFIAAALAPRHRPTQARLADVCALLGFETLRVEAERAAR